MPNKSKLPDRYHKRLIVPEQMVWEDYCPFGEVIERTCILPLKVPLKEYGLPDADRQGINKKDLKSYTYWQSLSNRYEEAKRFTPQSLIDMLNDRGLTLGLIIDLTYTTKYYSPEEFTKKGIYYQKIYVEGHRIPSDEVVYQMFEIINTFQQDVNFNSRAKAPVVQTKVAQKKKKDLKNMKRAEPGYFFPNGKFLMDVLGWKSGEAIDAFNKARFHPIYRENYVNDLHRRGKLHERGMPQGPPRGSFQRGGWRGDHGGFRGGGSGGFDFGDPRPSFSRNSRDILDTHSIVSVEDLTSNQQSALKYAASVSCPEHMMEGKIRKLVKKTESQDFLMPSVKKPTKHCPLQVSAVFKVKGPDDKNPQYTDLVCLPEEQVMLIDSKNYRCCLLDSLFHNISSYTLSNKPRRVSMFDGQEVAVSLRNKNQIQFLSVKDNTFRPTRMIKTRLPCFGIALAGKGSVVVAGPNFARNKCYWSVINDRGKETSYHEYCDSAWNDSYLALNVSKTRVYISTYGTNSLLCFDIAGRSLFVYHPDNLICSYGITLDTDDNVYVVGKDSKNIHQLSPDGVVLQILTAELPQYPAAITYNRTRNQLLLTNRSSENKKIHVIKLS